LVAYHRREVDVTHRRRAPELQTLPYSPHRVTFIPSKDLRKLDGWSGPAYRPSLVRLFFGRA